MGDRDLKRFLPLLFGLAGLKLLLQLAFVGGYGMFRDEFYYIACSERLAFGYVDHPPLSLLVLRGVRLLLGDSLFAIRLLPALTGAATVFLTGLMVREMRGDRFAAALAMVGVIASPMFLGSNHIYSMNCFEILFWALAAYVVLRLCNAEASDGGGVATNERWLWMLLGLILGLGLLNKVSVLWLGFGLAVGLLLTPLRRKVLTPWPWLGAGLALLLFTPHVIWQVVNGWPTLEFIRNATQNKMVQVDLWGFVMGQIGAMNRISFPLWLCGLVFFFALARGRSYRILGWVYVTVFVLLVFNGTSRSGYLAPAYTWLMAGGAVAIEGWTTGAAARTWLRPALVSVIALAGLAFAPFGLPMLPVETYIDYARALGIGPHTSERKELAELPQWYADMHGWEALAETVIEVYDALDPEEQGRVTIFTGNYGEAGAITYFGRSRGLPAAISGHNNYWLWGPGSRPGDVAIVIGASREGVERRFRDVERAGATSCRYCMPYENDVPIFVGRNPYQPLDELWAELKHYD